eukprot:CAMPEP_0179357402 /NCGR_PEP_ID=MMETSP0797-20121207/78386_1 /TAXON_ID=47934 /ORGANISM="Dinophysis acuminata, Strain DAEP01" /LENGTH=132 /DNA_ID=CAMNT_0021072611 /DNA_START=114 /DNA_END=512 /DNA_ORIENTATION=+
MKKIDEIARTLVALQMVVDIKDFLVTGSIFVMRKWFRSRIWAIAAIRAKKMALTIQASVKRQQKEKGVEEDNALTKSIEKYLEKAEACAVGLAKLGNRMNRPYSAAPACTNLVRMHPFAYVDVFIQETTQAK